jgi:hypothetical protein
MEASDLENKCVSLRGVTGGGCNETNVAFSNTIVPGVDGTLTARGSRECAYYVVHRNKEGGRGAVSRVEGAVKHGLTVKDGSAGICDYYLAGR